MQCPKCTTIDMVIVERQGLEIDYCPQCRGVWLDRGELDKLIERSHAEVSPGMGAASSDVLHGSAVDRQDHQRDHYHEHGHWGERKHSHRGHYRRKSLLEKIFDFD